MKYLFISGAPRSGTSALTELLSSHPKVALGMERYKFLYKKSLVNKSVFEESKFFNFLEEQTNINSTSGKYVDYYSGLVDKYKKCSILGDKYPQLYKFWDSLYEEFGESGKYLFIIRDIEDVASSFNIRAENPKDKWPEENDYKKAVQIWNESLDIAEKNIDRGSDICVVSYAKLFDSEKYCVETEMGKISQYLNLTLDDKLCSMHLKMSSDYTQKIKYREKCILDGQAKYIEQHANIDLCNKLVGNI